MEKFLALMANQFEQQTMLLKRLHRSDAETGKEEVGENG